MKKIIFIDFPCIHRTQLSTHILIEDLLIKEVGVLRVALLEAILKCMLVRENGCVVAANVGITVMNSAPVIIKDSVVIDFDILLMTDVVVVYQTSTGEYSFSWQCILFSTVT